MLIDLDSEREVYVIFQGESEYRFSSWFKKGFKHVFCIERMGLGWLCMDPSRSDMISTILPASYSVDVMTRYIQDNPDNTIVKLIIRPTTRHNYPRPGIISCVSAVQYYLGVYWPFILTPYQLYNRLSTIDHYHIRKEQVWEMVAHEMQHEQHHEKQKRHKDYCSSKLKNKKLELLKTQNALNES